METETKDLPDNFSEMLSGYVEMMLFANSYRWQDGMMIESFDARGAQLTEEAKARAQEELQDFYHLAVESEPEELARFLFDDGPQAPDEFGCRFALSRNGHGAGFFDAGPGFSKLQRLARTMGPASLVLTETGEMGPME